MLVLEDINSQINIVTGPLVIHAISALCQSAEENKRSQTILSDSSFTQLKNNLFRWSTLPNGLAFPYQLALQDLQKQTHCSRQMRWSESHFSATAQWARLKCEWSHRLLNGQVILEKKKIWCSVPPQTVSLGLKSKTNKTPLKCS